MASTTTTFNSNNNIQETDPVRLALLLDYVAAAISMSTAAAYLALSSPIVGGSSSWVDADAVLPALGVSALGLAFLGLSWRYERGRPYMVFHSAWHFCSAYAGLLIGTLHASTAAAVAVAVPSVHAFAAVVVATAGGGV